MTITLGLIIITCLISLAGFSNQQLINNYAHYPKAEHDHKEWVRMLSSGFLHGDYFHLFVNMFVLYGFGQYIEAMYQQIYGTLAGKVMFVLFYLFMIILANLPTYVKFKDNASYRSIGASGATSAIVFAYIVFEPWSMLKLYLFIPIPAILFGVLYLWYSHYASKRQADFIDHDAHFFGALGGFLFTILMKKELIVQFYQKLTAILH